MYVTLFVRHKKFDEGKMRVYFVHSAVDGRFTINHDSPKPLQVTTNKLFQLPCQLKNFVGLKAKKKTEQNRD